jgi:hypothetical protein
MLPETDEARQPYGNVKIATVRDQDYDQFETANTLIY